MPETISDRFQGNSIIRIGLLAFLTAMICTTSSQLSAQGVADLTDQERAWVRENRVIRIGNEMDWPPFDFVENGKPAGYSIAYVKLVAENVGLKVNFVNGQTWAELVESFKQKKIDVLPVIANTKERQKFARFTKPYLEYPTVLVVRDGEEEGIEGVGNLVGQKIAIVRGYYYFDVVKTAQPDVIVVPVNGFQEGLEALQNGEVKAFIGSPAVVHYTMKKHFLYGLKIASRTGIDDPVKSMLNMGVHRDNEILLSILQKSMDSLDVGKVDELKNRWLFEDPTKAENVDQEDASQSSNWINWAFLVVAILIVLLGSAIYRSVHHDKAMSLRHAWPLFALAVCISILIVSIALYLQDQLYQRYQNDIQSELSGTLSMTNDAALNWLAEREQVVKEWAKLPDAIEIISRLTSPDRIAPLKLPPNLRTLLSDRGYEHCLITNSQGKIVAAHGTLADKGVSKDMEDFITRVLSSPVQSAIELPQSFEAGNPSMIQIGTVIHDQQGGVQGSFIIGIRPEHEFSKVLQSGRTGQSGETYAFNREALLISLTRRLDELHDSGLVQGDNKGLGYPIRLPRRPDASSTRQGSLTDMAASATGGSNGMDVDGYQDFRDIKVVGAWRWNKRNGFGVATEMNFTEAYASWASIQRLGVLATAFQVGLILVLTSVFVWYRLRMAEANAQLTASQIKIEEQYGIIEKQKDRMQEELDVGRDIQLGMVPSYFPQRDEFEVHAVLEPAREVGGDFYDCFFLGKNKLCLVIGDVSGKGVPAALFMAMAKTLIKSRASSDGSTASIITHANDELSQNNDECMFVTLFVAILDLPTGQLTFTNAGHNPPYIQKANKELIALEECDGPVVGAAEGMAYTENCITMDRGDVFVLFTDGVTEADDTDHQLFSEARLEEIIQGLDMTSIPDAVRTITDAVHAYEGDNRQADDITVMMIRFNGKQDPSIQDSVELTIRNEIDQLDMVHECADRFIEQQGLDASGSAAVHTALDELVTNVISYGFTDDKSHDIDIKIECVNDIVSVMMSDDGIPFDPFSTPAPDTTSPLEEREIGGLGIHLVCSMFQTLDYQRRNGRNIVTVSKSAKI